MRTSSLLALLALAACGTPPPTPQNLEQTRPPEGRATPVEKVSCARGDGAVAPVCTLDREPIAGGQRWTIRFPDGSFRRLEVKGDEVREADGAEPLRRDGADAVIADERYRLPAH